MLCSVPAGKSTSNWLDRLRTTRGFPTSSGVDIDHFLAVPPNTESTIPSPSPDPSTSEPAPPSTSQRSAGDGNSGKEWFGIMSNVLSELFVMGDQPPCQSKKSSRKQINPRICPNFVKRDEAAIMKFRQNPRNSPNSPEKTADGHNVGLADEEETVSEEDELAGYSRSEVTVIDTSIAEWKFEKLLFRRKNVWKVRERKGKSRGGLGKKKKRKLAAFDDAIVKSKKKQKVSGSFNKGLENPNGSRLVCKSNKIVDNPPSRSQGPQMRFLSSVTPKKPRNRSSADKKKNLKLLKMSSNL